MEFEKRLEVVEYDVKSKKDRHVYCRFVSIENDSIVELKNGARFAQGWELTTLEPRDRAYFDANLGEFYSMQTKLPKQVAQKVERWKNGDEAIAGNVATLFKNKSYALRWFRLR